jgi:hypothetical protein
MHALHRHIQHCQRGAQAYAHATEGIGASARHAKACVVHNHSVWAAKQGGRCGHVPVCMHLFLSMHASISLWINKAIFLSLPPLRGGGRRTFRNCAAPWAMRTSRSISPKRRPPSRARPSMGCRVMMLTGPLQAMSHHARTHTDTHRVHETRKHPHPASRGCTYNR